MEPWKSHVLFMPISFPINNLSAIYRRPNTKPIRLNRPFSPLPLSRFPGLPHSNGASHKGVGPSVQAASEFNFLFDFDEWSRLAKTDPAAFEARRLAIIEEYLRQFPPLDQRRLRGLQFRIDMERRRARTPMAACLRLSSMMWDSLLGARGLKATIDRLLHGNLPKRPTTVSARILPFKKPAY